MLQHIHPTFSRFFFHPHPAPYRIISLNWNHTIKFEILFFIRFFLIKSSSNFIAIAIVQFPLMETSKHRFLEYLLDGRILRWVFSAHTHTHTTQKNSFFGKNALRLFCSYSSCRTQKILFSRLPNHGNQSVVHCCAHENGKATSSTRSEIMMKIISTKAHTNKETYVFFCCCCLLSQ